MDPTRNSFFNLRKTKSSSHLSKNTESAAGSKSAKKCSNVPTPTRVPENSAVKGISFLNHSDGTITSILKFPKSHGRYNNKKPCSKLTRSTATSGPISPLSWVEGKLISNPEPTATSKTIFTRSSANVSADWVKWSDRRTALKKFEMSSQVFYRDFLKATTIQNQKVLKIISKKFQRLCLSSFCKDKIWISRVWTKRREMCWKN